MRYVACLTTLVLMMVLVADDARAQAIPFDSDRWDIQAGEKRIGEYLGRKSLYLKDGTAVVKNSQFTDGVIEFDIAFSNERNFAGVMWRMKDTKNFEEFYFRPHQSGNPDANQYQPVFNGGTAWQLLYGSRYSAPVKYDFDQWMQVKIVVSGQSAEVYIKDMNTPALFINELMHDSKNGRVGISSANLAGAYFSNFSFTPAAAPVLKGKPQRESIPAGTVTLWQVSNPFDQKALDAKYRLTDTDKRNLTWKQLATDGGFANLSRLQGTAEGQNTVFARITIRSESDQIKKVKFGFSDLVKVYFNDVLIYGGSDIYRSRDYRFLGTVGLFDELYLPLKKGDNELWFAVTENFGGWIVGAVFDDMSGITINAKP
jgi:hypothetical protein